MSEANCRKIRLELEVDEEPSLPSLTQRPVTTARRRGGDVHAALREPLGAEARALLVRWTLGPAAQLPTLSLRRWSRMQGVPRAPSRRWASAGRGRLLANAVRRLCCSSESAAGTRDGPGAGDDVIGARDGSAAARGRTPDDGVAPPQGGGGAPAAISDAPPAAKRRDDSAPAPVHPSVSRAEEGAASRRGVRQAQRLPASRVGFARLTMPLPLPHAATDRGPRENSLPRVIRLVAPPPPPPPPFPRTAAAASAPQPQLARQQGNEASPSAARAPSAAQRPTRAPAPPVPRASSLQPCMPAPPAAAAAHVPPNAVAGLASGGAVSRGARDREDGAASIAPPAKCRRTAVAGSASRGVRVPPSTDARRQPAPRPKRSAFVDDAAAEDSGAECGGSEAAELAELEADEAAHGSFIADSSQEDDASQGMYLRSLLHGRAGATPAWRDGDARADGASMRAARRRPGDATRLPDTPPLCGCSTSESSLSSFVVSDGAELSEHDDSPAAVLSAGGRRARRLPCRGRLARPPRSSGRRGEPLQPLPPMPPSSRLAPTNRPRAPSMARKRPRAAICISSSEDGASLG